MKRKTLLLLFALFMALQLWAGDVVCLRFWDGSIVFWQGSALPAINTVRDSVFVKAEGKTVGYPSRGVESVYIGDDKSAQEMVDAVASVCPKSEHRVIIEGRAVRFDGKGALYTLDGRRVASGIGLITAPCSGAYVLHTDYRTLKILVP